MKKVFSLWIIFLFFSFTSKVFPSNPEWIVYTIDSLKLPSKYSDTRVFQLEVDKNDRILTLWDKVIAVYDYPNWLVFENYAKIDDTTYEYFGVFDMAGDFQNSFWFATTCGLVKFTPGVDTVPIRINNIPRGHLSEVVPYNGYLWISSRYGIIRYDGTDYTLFNEENGSLPDKYLSILAIDSNGVFWLFDGDNLLLWDGNNWTYLDTTNSPFPGPPDQIYEVNVFVDPRNNKWICSRFRWNDFTPKIYKYDGETWTLYDSSKVPELRGLFSANFVAFDSRGNKWITVAGHTSPGGLIKFDDSTWTVFNQQNSGFPAFDGGKVVVDSKDNVWVSTRVGLVVYREGGVLFNSVEEGDSPLAKPLTDFVFPNPASKTIEIKFNAPNTGFVSFEVYTTNGKLVDKVTTFVSQTGLNTQIMDLSAFPSGTYLIKVHIGNRTEVKKVVLNK